MSGDVDVITGSIAFGMGVDKADVRCKRVPTLRNPPLVVADLFCPFVVTKR